MPPSGGQYCKRFCIYVLTWFDDEFEACKTVLEGVPTVQAHAAVVR